MGGEYFDVVQVLIVQPLKVSQGIVDGAARGEEEEPLIRLINPIIRLLPLKYI